VFDVVMDEVIYYLLSMTANPDFDCRVDHLQSSGFFVSKSTNLTYIYLVQIAMYTVSLKFIFVILGSTLVLSLGDGAVQAQSVPSEEIPNSSQPSSEQAKPRSLRNYIGITGNIGVSGDGEGLSQGGVAIIRKNDLSDSLSVRGVTILGGEQTDSTLALTVNFPIKSSSGRVQLTPFIGGGMLIRSKSIFQDITVRGLVTSGIDIPLSSRLTAITVVNVGFFEQSEVGVQLGVAYNF
jgi:hypothetical protein